MDLMQSLYVSRKISESHYSLLSAFKKLNNASFVEFKRRKLPLLFLVSKTALLFNFRSSLPKRWPSLRAANPMRISSVD